MHYSLNFIALILIAAFAAPINAAETLICSDRCPVISCTETNCSVFSCEEGSCSVRGEFEAGADFTSAAPEKAIGDGVGIHCGNSRCAITTCDEQQCNTFGFDQGDHQVLHSAANPEAARNRAVQAFLGARSE